MNYSIISSFAFLLINFQNCFTKPSYNLFKSFVIGWLATPGRKTVANIMRTLGETAQKSHDAYQDFFSENKWELDAISKNLFTLMLLKLLPKGEIRLGGDDTLAKHFGRKIFGIGIFRDPVRSNDYHTSFILAHNWVILYVIVKVQFIDNIWLALPVCSRLRPKQKSKLPKNKEKENNCEKSPKTDKTMVMLMKEMIELVVSFAPQRQFIFVSDAAYGSLLGQLPTNVFIVSRIRKDAKLFAPPKFVKGKLGRPCKKGAQLPTPYQTSQKNDWHSVNVIIYGESITLQVHSYTGLWYNVCQNILIRVVITHDPKGKYQDQFFFTQNLSLSETQVIEIIASRWSVEVAHRELKQYLGMEEPQSRLEHAVKRQAPFAMFLLSLVKIWYLTEGYLVDSFRDVKDNLYPHKQGIPFTDMLRLLRCSYWDNRIFNNSNFCHEQRKIISQFIQFFSRVACFLIAFNCYL